MTRVVEWWIQCDICRVTRGEQRAGETAAEARARLARDGWRREGKWDICPAHPVLPIRPALELVTDAEHFAGCPTPAGRPFDCDYCQERAKAMGGES